MEKLQYTIDEIKKFNDAEWKEFRKARWQQYHEAYADPNNIPETFWRLKDADPVKEEIRRKAWVNKCKKYAAEEPAPWFLRSKQNYIETLEKNILKQRKIQERLANK